MKRRSDPAALSPAARLELQKLARGAAALFVTSRSSAPGFRAGLVRKVELGTRTIRALVVQTAGGDPFARTLSARYRGPKIRLEGRELEFVWILSRGRRLSLEDVLERSRSSSSRSSRP